MKKTLVLFVMLTMAFSLFTAQAFADDSENLIEVESSDKNSYIEGELIVSIEGEVDGDQGIQSTDEKITQTETLEDHGFEIVESLLDGSESDTVHTFDNDFKEEIVKNMGIVYLTKYESDAYDSIDEAKEQLEKTLSDLGLTIRYVDKNYEMYALEDTGTEDVTVDMHPNQEWHYEMIHAPDAWDISTGSSQVLQAVLDTGIDHNHESLSDLVDTDLGESFVGGTTMDVQGHGTHVAGTIASYGSVSGVMHEASLVPVKVLDDNGMGSAFGIQQGILYAADIGADVINMSLGGGGYHQGTAEATQTAVNAGTIVVAASGNDSSSSISYPAGYDSVIAVGSVTSNETRSSFSNYGDGLELMAPGSNIYSTVPNNGYATYSGTSMASPHVAGVAGLLRSVDSDISVSEVRTIMNDTAQPAGSFFEYGHGIVDAYEAVASIGGDPDPEGETQTALSTDQDVYERGDQVTITATVTDENDSALQGADVQFTITRPNGSTIHESTTTNASGEATWSIGSDSQTALGEYTIEAETNLSGYSSSSDSTTISFAEEGNMTTSTTVSTDRSYVIPGQSVTSTAEVTDANDEPLAGATVEFTITRPNGTTLTTTETTNSSGVASWTVGTDWSTAPGTYEVEAVSSLSGYEESSDTTEFYVY